MDVEGAEPLVVQGMAETLKTRRPDLSLACGSEQQHAILMSMLEPYGYTAFWHAALHFNPNNVRRVGNMTGSKGDMNILCVPRERLQGEHAAVWQGLSPVREWAEISALFPGFVF